MNEELRREIILEHYTSPINRHKPDNDDYENVNTRNASCIDNLDIFVKLSDNKIEDIVFDGEACAISISSTSIMIKSLIGKTVDEALEFIDNFENMINEKEYNADVLEEAIVYNEIYKQNSRKNCAHLPYRGIKQILEKHKNN